MKNLGKYALVMLIAFFSVIMTGCVELSKEEIKAYKILERNGYTWDMQGEGEYTPPNNPWVAGSLNVVFSAGNLYLATGRANSPVQAVIFFPNLIFWPITCVWSIPQCAIDAIALNKRYMVDYYLNNPEGQAEMRQKGINLGKSENMSYAGGSSSKTRQTMEPGRGRAVKVGDEFTLDNEQYMLTECKKLATGQNGKTLIEVSLCKKTSTFPVHFHSGQEITLENGLANCEIMADVCSETQTMERSKITIASIDSDMSDYKLKLCYTYEVDSDFVPKFVNVYLKNLNGIKETVKVNLK